MDIRCLEKKIMVLGDHNVGKTSICKHAFNSYDERYVDTIGSRVSKKVMNVNHPKCRYIVNMMIWECKEKMEMKEADGAFMVYDVTNRGSMERMENYWIPAFKNVNNNASMVFVANKWNLKEGDYDDFLEVKYHSPCVLISAKTGENIDFVFEEMGKMLAKPYYYNEKRLFVPGKLKPGEAYTLIASSFINSVGSKDPALPILVHECRTGDINPEKISKKDLSLLIQKLSEIERGFLDSYTVKKNMMERKGITEKI
jgi:small GTP-binding protein